MPIIIIIGKLGAAHRYYIQHFHNQLSFDVRMYVCFGIRFGLIIIIAFNYI